MMPFIVLEGCDGAGKTTLREMLRRELEAIGHATVTVGQHSWLHPWYSRALVAARENRRTLPPQLLREAYLHDKRLHGLRNVHPVRSKAIVIADRWFYSDAVYHAALYGIPPEDTLERHRQAGTEVPNLLVHVAIDADCAYERILMRGQHTRHYERPADLRRIVAGYSYLFDSGLVADTHLITIANAAGLSELRSCVVDTLVPAVRHALSKAQQ